jgi:hypothetical protein
MRQRAAMGLYERYDPDKIVAEQGAAKALQTHVQGDEPSAAAFLLLGYVSGNETQRLLHDHVRRASETDLETKLFPWSEPVATSLPAQVALARLGDRAAMAEVVKSTEDAAAADVIFLLTALRDIDAPRVLHAIKQALDDPRETSAGVPSETEPKRRICDEAVNAFVQRLKLAVSFPLNDTQRYRAGEIDEVRRKIDMAIPQ